MATGNKINSNIERECLLVVGRGSWVTSRGSWVLSRGSWVPSRGSWVPSRGSWWVVEGICILTQQTATFIQQ